MSHKFIHYILGGASIAALSAGASVPSFAQDGRVDELVVVQIGTRGKPRSAVESPVAIDAFNTADVLSAGATETGRMLQELVPSFNFSSSSISDGTDALRPATLRGLGPDQTLVLINGKRRHKSALIHVNTSVGRGTAGTDINAIPQAAIKGVEVLRDGASALYGSDAIAGVINFNLNDDNEAGSVMFTTGQTYESDGLTYTAAANKGFAIGEDGFINIAYEYRNRDSTNRAGLQGTCQYLCSPYMDGEMADPSTTDLEEAFDRQSFRIGDAESEQHLLFVNMEKQLTDSANFYAFGSYGDRENESGGFYRRANQGERTLLEIYPHGFLPIIQTDVEDMSISAGVEWDITDSLSLDSSITYGENSFGFNIINTNNVSLGPTSPTEFDAGELELSEINYNLDAVWTRGIHTVAFGAGFRTEEYKLKEGEPDSYANGGYMNMDTVYSPVIFSPIDGAAGAQVFRGFGPSNVADEERDSWSVYGELSSDFMDGRLNTQVAVRHENYDGFGGSTTWKVAGIGEVTDRFRIRGSVSTGFRAPSMQQLYFSSTSTQFVDDGMGGTIAEERGTFRNDSDLAMGLGIPELKEEESFSWGVGFVLEPFDGATLTVDYYSIDIDDRIMISGSQAYADVSPAAQAVYDSVGATAGQFFINGVDTETTGVDIVGTYDVQRDIAGGDLTLTFGANITETDVTKELPAPGLLAGLDLVTPQDISIIEEWQPKDRINFGAKWTKGPWTVNLTESRYGEYTTCEGSCDDPDPTSSTRNVQDFDAKWLTDINIDYAFDNGLTLSVGANNLFDETPDTNLIGQSRGGKVYSASGDLIVDSNGVFDFSRRSAPFGFNGGYYYARLKFDF